MEEITGSRCYWKNDLDMFLQLISSVFYFRPQSVLSLKRSVFWAGSSIAFKAQSNYETGIQEHLYNVNWRDLFLLPLKKQVLAVLQFSENQIASSSNKYKD